MSRSLFQALRESEVVSKPQVPSKASKVMSELRESTRLMEFKTRLHEAFKDYASLVDGEVIPGDTEFSQVADRLAKKALDILNSGKQLKDKGGCTYRWAVDDKDWDGNKDLAHEWLTLNGEKMVVVEKGGSWGLLTPDLYALSEFIEQRIPKLFTDERDEAKIEDSFFDSAQVQKPAEERVEVPDPKKVQESLKKAQKPAKKIPESLKHLRKVKSMTESQKSDFLALHTQTVTTDPHNKGVGGSKSGQEEVVDSEFLKEEIDAILKEEFGDTNPTALLIWFPGFLAQRLKMVGAECENTSDSWDEFGTMKEGKVYTSSYKITPGSGVPLNMNLAVMDCDDHWEIEYELSYADGNWEQITDKTGDQVVKGPKDQLRQLLGKIISLVKEVCNKRKEKDDFRDDSKKLDQGKEEKEAAEATAKAEKLEKEAAELQKKASEAIQKEKDLARKMEQDPDLKYVDQHTKAKNDADDAQVKADRATAKAEEARARADELNSYVAQIYGSKPSIETIRQAVGESCNAILQETRRLRCSGYVPNKITKGEETLVEGKADDSAKAFFAKNLYFALKKEVPALEWEVVGGTVVGKKGDAEVCLVGCSEQCDVFNPVFTVNKVVEGKAEKLLTGNYMEAVVAVKDIAKD